MGERDSDHRKGKPFRRDDAAKPFAGKHRCTTGKRRIDLSKDAAYTPRSAYSSSTDVCSKMDAGVDRTAALQSEVSISLLGPVRRSRLCSD
jgi:hypothetical protein